MNTLDANGPGRPVNGGMEIGGWIGGWVGGWIGGWIGGFSRPRGAGLTAECTRV